MKTRSERHFDYEPLWVTATRVFDKAFEFYLAPGRVKQLKEEGWKQVKYRQHRMYSVIKENLKKGNFVIAGFNGPGRKENKNYVVLYKEPQI